MRIVGLAHGTRRCRRGILLTLIICVLLTACSGVNTRTAEGQPIRMTKDEFAEYVESTFRYHNRVVNEMITIFSLSGDEIPFEPALVRAEDNMDARCQPLNEMVMATIEGRELSMWAKLQLINQVPECAAATRRVESVLPASF